MCRSTCPYMEARGWHQSCQLLLQLPLLKQNCSLDLELTDLVTLTWQWGPEFCLSLPSTGLWLTQPHSVFNVVTGSQPRSLSKHVTHWDILCFSIFKENGRGACLYLSQHSTVWFRGLEEHQLCQEPHCSTQYLLQSFPSIEYKAAPHTHTLPTLKGLRVQA